MGRADGFREQVYDGQYDPMALERMIAEGKLAEPKRKVAEQWIHEERQLEDERRRHRQEEREKETQGLASDANRIA